MNRFLSIFLLLLVAGLTLTCGNGSGRRLQSIAISKTTSGSQIQFTATGTFSAAPTTLTPLPVDWSMGLFAPPPKQFTYSLATQPFVVDCNAVGSGPGQVSAVAPSNPSVSGNGTLAWSELLVANSSFTCP